MITIFATVDAFFGGFAVGFNSRHVLIGDPSIPDPKTLEKKVTEATPAPAAVVPTAAAKPPEKPKAAEPAKKGATAKEKPAAARSNKAKPAAKKTKAKPGKKG